MKPSQVRRPTLLEQKASWPGVRRQGARAALGWPCAHGNPGGGRSAVQLINKELDDVRSE